jgi:ADP-heptose:LPS heptosyltransferase
MRTITKFRPTVQKIINLLFSPAVLISLVRLARFSGLLKKMKDSDTEKATRIFVSFPFTSIGDVIVMLPLLERINDLWPEARIHIAIGSTMANFVSRLPFIERVFSVPPISHEGRVIWRVKEFWKTLRLYQQEISRFQYRLAIAPRWGSDLYSQHSRYLMYMTGADQRCAYSSSVDGAPRSIDRYSTCVAVGGHVEAEAVRQLKLLERVHLIEPQNDPPALKCLNASLLRVVRGLRLDELNLPEKYIVVSPGATKVTHRWPGQRYKSVICALHERHQIPVLVIGGKSDMEVCSGIARELPDVVLSLAGRTTIDELISVLYKSALFIGNDSGPGHIASGLGVPCVSINPFPKHGDLREVDAAYRWVPSGPHVVVLQPEVCLSPCVGICRMKCAHCILQITIDQVLAAAENFLLYDTKSIQCRS